MHECPKDAATNSTRKISYLTQFVFRIFVAFVRIFPGRFAHKIRFFSVPYEMTSISLLHCSFLSVASDVWRLPLTARVGACRVIVSYSQPIRFVRVDLGHAQSDKNWVNHEIPVLDFLLDWPKGARPLGTRMIFSYSPSFYMAEHFTSNMEPLVRTYFTRSRHFACKPLAFPSVLFQTKFISANK